MNPWIFNPFKYIAGSGALMIGWAIMLVTACISFFSKTHFDGVIDAHHAVSISFQWYIYLPEAFIAWGSAVIMFYVAGLIFSGSSIRFIDVAGTMALARWPAIFVALINFAMPDVIDLHKISAAFIVTALAGLIFIVWMIVLMYHAFMVSCNLKGSKAGAVFIIALLVAEVLSKFALYQLYRHFA
jgi:hypothetical protein